MEDWVKVLLLLAAIVAVYKVCNAGEKFSSPILTATPSPSMGTTLADATGLPLTDAVSGMPLPNGCQPPSSIDTDLLPKPCVSGDADFSEFAPNPSALANMSFVDPSKFIGASTTSGSLRNSSHEIRDTVPVPVCPGAWGSVYKSTIEPDPWRKSIGCFPSSAPTSA